MVHPFTVCVILHNHHGSEQRFLIASVTGKLHGERAAHLVLLGQFVEHIEHPY